MNLNKPHPCPFGNVCPASEIPCVLPYSQGEGQLLLVWSVIEVVNPSVVFGGEPALGAESKQTVLPSPSTDVGQG